MLSNSTDATTSDFWGSLNRIRPLNVLVRLASLRFSSDCAWRIKKTVLVAGTIRSIMTVLILLFAFESDSATTSAMISVDRVWEQQGTEASYSCS